MRKEKGGKRGRKKTDEREKESQVEERSEVITEEGTERREEDEIDCPEGQPLLPRSPRGSAYCQQPLHRRLVQLKQQLAAVLCTIHQAPLASATRHLS